MMTVSNRLARLVGSMSVWLAVLFGLIAPAAQADQTSVTLEAPSQAVVGDVVSVVAHVTHEGNNFFHFTDWVFLKANDQEIARWEFSAENRPEAENFTRRVDYTITGPVTFTAQGNCNIHGGTGVAQASVATTAAVGAAEHDAASNNGGKKQPSQGKFNVIGFGLFATGIINFILLAFQVATGRRWIRVKIVIHRRAGQTLLISAIIHGILAFVVSM